MAYKRRLGTMSLQVRVADGDAQQASPGTLNLLGPPVPVTNEPKIVYLTRHGEAEHNPTADWNLRDPALTEEGRRQAKALRNDEMLKRVLQPGTNGLNLIVVSPLKRCLETARLLFESMHSIRAPIIAHSDIQETSESPCDTGHPPISLSVEFPEIDFDQVPANWFDKGVKGNDLASIRLQRFQNWLAARPEKNILIIAHLNSLKQLTGDSLSLRNCAVARYTFSHRGWIDVNNASSGGVGMGASSRVTLTSSTISSVGTGGTKRLFTSPGSNGIMSASRQSNASSSAYIPPSSHHSGGRPPLPSAQSSSSSIGWDKDAVRGETSGSNLDTSSRDREAAAKNRMSPAELAAALFHGVLSDVDAATGQVHTKLKRSELSDGLRRTWGLELDIVEQIVAQSNAEARSRGGVPGDITEIDMARGLCGSDMSIVRSIASKRVAAKQGLMGSSMTRKLSDSRLLDSELNATKRPRSDARYLPTSSRSAQQSATPSRGGAWDLPSSSSSSSTPAIRPKSAVPTFRNGSGEVLGAVEGGPNSSSPSPRSKAREPSWLRSATGHRSASPLRASHASSKSTRSSGAPGGHLEEEELAQDGVGNDTSMKDAYASSMDDGKGVYRDSQANDGMSGQGQGGGGGVSFGGPSPWDVAEAYGSVGMGGMKRKASELDAVKTENKALARRVEALETELRDRDASSFHVATLVSSLEAEVDRLSGLLDSAKRGCKVMYERGKVARAAAQEEFERLRLEAQAAKEELLAIGLSSSTLAQAVSSVPAQSTSKSAHSNSSAGLQHKANSIAQMKMGEMQMERRGAPPTGALAAANEAAAAIGASTLSSGSSISGSSGGSGVRDNLAAKASSSSNSNSNNNNSNNNNNNKNNNNGGDRVSGQKRQEQRQGLGAVDLLQALDFPDVYGWKDYVSGVMEGGVANVAAHSGGVANGGSNDKNSHSRTAVKYKKPEGGRGGMRAFGKASGKATWETMAGLDPSQSVAQGVGDVAMEW